MVEIADIVFNSAMISSLYALLAIGFTLIMGIRGVLNLAHGSLMIVSAYGFLILHSVLPAVVAFPVSVFLAAGASYVLYIGLVRYVEDNVVITFMTTLVVAFVVQHVATFFFTDAPRSLVPLVGGGMEVLGTRVRINLLLAFIVSWFSIVLLWMFVKRTQTGRAILATAMSERGAILNGVSITRVNMTTWAIAGAMAGVAGIFFGALNETSPQMWLEPLALSFIIVVIGGVGSIKGSVVGAYLIGTLETVTVSVAGPQYRGLFALLLLLAVILVKPEGIYGREFIE